MRLSLKEKLILSVGNLGISLITVIHMLFLVYVFFPSDNAEITPVIPQGNLFLGFTVLGIILFTSRLFDVVTDPIIAHWSDNSRHKLGRRVPYMRRFALPMGAAYVGVFFVPFVDKVHHLNVVWVTAFMFASALFLTLYSIPYYSLVVDKANTTEDRIDLGTFSSVFWFAGFLIVSFTTGSWKFFEHTFGISRMDSIQVSFVVIGIIGTILMLIPAYVIKEDQASVSKVTRISLLKALRHVTRDKNYMAFLGSNLMYGIATYIFESGLIFYITVLALMDENIQGVLVGIIGVLTLLTYPIINKTSKKKGKKPVMIIGFLLFSVSFVIIGVLGWWHINPIVLLVLLVLLTPYSQACFGILLGVVTADCASYDEVITGENHTGMYVAVGGFVQKLGASLGTIIFTGFLLLGKNVGDDLGVRLVVFFAALLCLIGVLALLKYDEQTVLSLDYRTGATSKKIK